MKSYASPGTVRRGWTPLNAALIAVLIAIFSSAGCGKKGPPVPPDLKPLPTVDTLRTRVSGDTLQLVWDVSAGESLADPDGYYVYRAVRSLDDDCVNCPDNFRRVAHVPATMGFFGTRPESLTYKETLVKGNVYRYKVMAHSGPDLSGDFSNIVEVSY